MGIFSKLLGKQNKQQFKSPAAHEAAHKQHDNSTHFEDEAKYAKPPVSAPASSQPTHSEPAKPAGPQIVTYKLLFTGAFGGYTEAMMKDFLEKFVSKARYEWHHLKGRVGYDKNRGKMRVVVQGDPLYIEKLINWVHHIYLAAHVTRVEKFVIHTPYPSDFIGEFQVKHSSWSD